MPGAAELERLSDRLGQAKIPFKENEVGVLTRDPSNNGVLLTDRA